jgi:heme oxygenase (mycobilin-producing)
MPSCWWGRRVATARRASPACEDDGVTIVRINAIQVSEGKGDELAKRFAMRAGAVDSAEGFEGFELLRPVDGRDTWLVVTRWKDQESFEKWVASPAFAHGHRGATGDHDHPPVAAHSELWSHDIVDLGRGGSSA